MSRASLVVAVLLAIAVLAVYLPSLDGSFQFDDQTSILENTTLRAADPVAWWSYWPTRGLCYVSLGVDYQLHGLRTRGYHLTNLFIHIAAAWVVFALLKLLLSTSLGTARVDGIAAAGAALFALHPLQSQAVAYTVQRATAMYALFYFCCAYAYLRARQGGSRRWIWWAIAYFAALLALQSKEPALSLPLGLLLLESVARGPRHLRWKMWLPFAPLLFFPLILAQMTGFAFGNAAPTLSGETELVSRTSYALTQLEVLARYWKLSLLPHGQNLDHDIAWRSSFGAPEALLAVFHALVLALAWFSFRRGQRLAAVGIAWFYICLLPESSIYPIADAMFEHRVYLSLFGLALAACTLLARASRVRPRATAVLAVVVLLALGGATMKRSALWADPLLLWEDVLNKSPRKARARMAVGWIASNRGELEKARRHLEEAVRLDGDYGMAWNNLGLVAQRLGDWTAAERAYDEALRLHPYEAVLHLNRGLARRQLGRSREAAEDIRRAMELDLQQAPRWRELLTEIEGAEGP
jgi:tetratricopeptide (TPR) repeat protein